jgi:hypothetical protein
VSDDSVEAQAAEGLEHLQAAALELLAAARAFIDVADGVIREPGAAATIVSVAAAVGRAVLAGASGAPAGEEPQAAEGGARRSPAT